jgi:antitoxin component YwqK of YwqJK toxin-antitoxin module
MKTQLTLLLLIFSFLKGFSQVDTAIVYTDVKYKSVEPEKALYLLKLYDNDSCHIFETYDKNRVILKSESFSDKKLQIKHSPSIKYIEGKKESIVHYLKNKKNGFSLSFNSQGLIIDSTYYKAGNKDGRNSAYWDSGKKKSEEYFVAGIQEGARLAFFENGTVAINEFYKKGKLISGVYLDSLGIPVKHEDLESQPLFPGGIKNFISISRRI